MDVMTPDQDARILLDFVLEAREVVHDLGNRLLDLERSPHDQELLNAVYRGLHSIKGGGAFLNLTALVELCHLAEDVLNRLRQNQLLADASIADVLLQVVDQLGHMFDEIDAGNDLPSADPQLLARLDELISRGSVQVAVNQPAQDGVESQSIISSAQEAISDDEFAALLDQLNTKDQASGGMGS